MSINVEFVSIVHKKYRKGEIAPLDIEQSQCTSFKGEGWPDDNPEVDFWKKQTTGTGMIIAPCDAWTMDFTFASTSPQYNTDEAGYIEYEFRATSSYDTFGNYLDELVKIAENLIGEFDESFGCITFLTAWKVDWSSADDETGPDYELIGPVMGAFFDPRNNSGITLEIGGWNGNKS